MCGRKTNTSSEMEAAAHTQKLTPGRSVINCFDYQVPLLLSKNLQMTLFVQNKTTVQKAMLRMMLDDV